VAGIVVAGAAYAARVAIKSYQQVKGGSAGAAVGGLLGGGLNRYYRGGFENKMSKREAALILGIRCVTDLSLRLPPILLL
jgi:hypothetical protein